MIKILIIVVSVAIITSFVAKNQSDEVVKTTPVTEFGAGKEDSENMITNSKSVAEKTSEVFIPAASAGKKLDLSGQGLTKTPTYVFGKTNTQELDLSNNKLEGSLQAEVRQLQSLRVLNLSNNQFTGVPAEVGQLKNLEVLDLSNNQLTGLPYEIGNLSNLKILNLKGNAYSSADLDTITQNLPATVVVHVD